MHTARNYSVRKNAAVIIRNFMPDCVKSHDIVTPSTNSRYMPSRTYSFTTIDRTFINVLGSCVQELTYQMDIDTELLTHLAATPVQKSAITALKVLNEAYDYKSSFSRGLRIDLNGLRIILISGTASIDETGKTVHVGDFKAQLRRTYYNITGLLESEGATWK